MEPLNLRDYEAHARKTLSKLAFDYYASGADDERTLDANESAFANLKLAYRVLRGVSRVDTRATVLGESLDLPILAAPAAFQRLAHPDGELAAVRAAGKVGTTYCLSTMSNTAVEAVVQAAQTPVWFQLYVYKDRAASRALIQRAEAAGCEALVLTVDAPVLGRRERDLRNKFHLPAGMTIENMLPQGYEQLPEPPTGSGLANYFASLLDPGLSWRDLDWVCGETNLPVLIKGIIRADDALRAAEHGVAGIVVSNHGGRQLDTAPAPIAALPHIVAAFQQGYGPHAAVPEIIVDGGIRRGTDVLKALALGARAVMIGRPMLWGLAVDGQAGVQRVFDLLADELRTAMALCGCRNLAEITPDLIF